MTLTIEKTKNGNPCIICNNIKYRQQRILKNGEISWRCLGRNCGASIKTDSGMTSVLVCNQKHSGVHPVTMRSLLSPLSRPQSPSTPPAPATPSSPSTSPAPACFKPASKTASDPALLAFTPSLGAPTRIASCSTPEDPAAEISRLKLEIDLLNFRSFRSSWTIPSILTHVFPLSTSRVDQTARASATVDCGVQCGLSLSPLENLKPQTTDFSAQRDPVECTRCADNVLLVNSQKTTIEVLEAEVQCIKSQLSSCDPHTNQKRTNLKTSPRHDETHNLPKNLRSPLTKISHFESVGIMGDSHARFIAGLVKNITGSSTSVSGICMSGAGLLDIVLIAGTNDLVVGEQHNIYRHLEAHITARPANTELALVILPYRHDLQPDHPIHDETVLVNAYIEELAARYNTRVINFNEIGHRHFTKHGQHLSMRGKRLLAGLIVKSLASQKPARTTSRIPAPLPDHMTGPATSAPPAAIPMSAATNGESAVGPQQRLNHQHFTYAEAARGSPTLGSDVQKGRSPASKNLKISNCTLQAQ
ncbi:hypothetical protein J6590_058826 [Homalodisca vitripennis]|nr:hypothetical protein J6590_058826 [Homalodisca vitripennis]